MKIQKEEVKFEAGRSFKLFTPSFRGYFMWHYHAEIELVYVEAINGIRHVGKHISDFMDSDLVLIGSNVPHLNFDYAIKTEYEQTVVQFRDDFPDVLIKSIPEFEKITHMLERSYLGLAFHGNTKAEVAKRLKSIDNADSFKSLLGIIEILQMLANSEEVEILNKENTRVKWFLNDKVRMGTIYNYVSTYYHKKPDVNEIAELVHLNPSSFCRYFRRQTDMTFTDFVNHYRINLAKTLLLQEETIAEVCYRVGYESISYFNKTFKKLIGETPSSFKKKYLSK
ncbi:AraC family transcriptional regulator [Sphingobacterium spiritivorum]|uniref:AraC family transcriptional regulator n=1 Tax=Sphingobacterium spiritivorum TaxID=258 RepID=UPI003DA5FC03